MAIVENRVHDATLIALECLIIPRMKLAMKSVTASAGRYPRRVLLKPKLRDFPGNTEGLQMTASKELTQPSNIDWIIWIDEFRGNITVEAGELSANERNFDHTHKTHSFLSWSKFYIL